jgi:hypothetical protein
MSRPIGYDPEYEESMSMVQRLGGRTMTREEEIVNMRVDELSMEELARKYGLPKKFDLTKRPPTDRDPVRNAKAFAVGKWLAQRKVKKTKRKKSGKAKTSASKKKSPKRKVKR